MDSPPDGRRLMDRVRDAIRVRHYSYQTEKAYLHWICRAYAARSTFSAEAQTKKPSSQAGRRASLVLKPGRQIFGAAALISSLAWSAYFSKLAWNRPARCFACSS